MRERSQISKVKQLFWNICYHFLNFCAIEIKFRPRCAGNSSSLSRSPSRTPWSCGWTWGAHRASGGKSRWYSPCLGHSCRPHHLVSPIIHLIYFKTFWIKIVFRYCDTWTINTTDGYFSDLLVFKFPSPLFNIYILTSINNFLFILNLIGITFVDQK